MISCGLIETACSLLYRLQSNNRTALVPVFCGTVSRTEQAPLQASLAFQCASHNTAIEQPLLFVASSLTDLLNKQRIGWAELINGK